MSEVYLEDVMVRYPDVVALDHVSLIIQEGEFLALLGPSGCGKTTTIRVIGGFIEPDQGDVFIDRKRVNQLPPFKRDVGMVFQNYALFPHKTVFGNIAFGLRMKREEKYTIDKKVREVVNLLYLNDLEDRYPHQLSGGQQQRVALARALVVNPSVLLLDEPLGALDKKLREEMQLELKNLQRRFGITTIFVTHDQEEALTMADRIAILNRGRIEQLGTPTDIYDNPVNKFVSDFIGISNVLRVKVSAIGNSTLDCRFGENLRVTVPRIGDVALGTDLEVAVRPEKIELVSESSDKTKNVVSGKVERMIYRGAVSLLYVRMADDSTLIVQLQNPPEPLKEMMPGEEVLIGWPVEACKILRG
jgi:spermidine/putrescine ABC transporter ATP-binding subunit